jgi:hypothetical protein
LEAHQAGTAVLNEAGNKDATIRSAASKGPHDLIHWSGLGAKRRADARVAPSNAAKAEITAGLLLVCEAKKFPAGLGEKCGHILLDGVRDDHQTGRARAG